MDFAKVEAIETTAKLPEVKKRKKLQKKHVRRKKPGKPPHIKVEKRRRGTARTK